MAWFHFSAKLLHRLSWNSKREPRRKRPWILEDLEGRQLLSHANPSVMFLPIIESNIISGPEGDLWVGGLGSTSTSAAIDRIGLDGSITSFPVPDVATIDAITAGPDGNVWFVGRSGGGDTEYVGDVTSGGRVAEFPIPDPGGQPFYGIDAIVGGPGGDVWFDYGGGNDNGIGRVTPAGVITLFPTPDQQWGVLSMAAGPDGNVWFTDGNPGVGRMTPSGAVSEFSTGELAPLYIGSGPDGSLIATATTARGNNTVIRITTAGIVTPYKVPAAISGAFEFNLGAADGSLWFSSINRLGRISASGKATSYPMSRIAGSRSHSVASMAIGANGDLYLIDYYSETINRIAPSKLPQVRETGMPHSPR